MNKKIMEVVALILLSLLVLGIAFAAISRTVTKTTAQLKGIWVSVYQDENCTVPLTSIDWGAVESPSSNNFTIYLKLKGDFTANLSLSTENWNPTNASTYITLDWDYDGHTLAIDEVLPITLTLTVAGDIPYDEALNLTSFSFDIVITATSV